MKKNLLKNQKIIYHFNIMKKYFIKSPTGRKFNVIAETIYHAVQKIVDYEGYKFSNIDYLKINKL